MSDKGGFVSELAGEIGRTSGAVIGAMLETPSEMIKEAAHQFEIPVAEQYKQAQKAVQPRIDYLSHQLRTLPRQEYQASLPQEKKALESPAKKSNKSFLHMIKRPDRKDQKGVAA